MRSSPFKYYEPRGDVRMPSAQKQPDIRFTVEQIQWLENMYPEITSLKDHDEMVFYAGKRDLINHIKRQSKVVTRHVGTSSSPC